MSLKLYYTGAVKFDKPQLDPIRSLGGYISASEIPNGLIGNMYGDISKFTVQQGKAEIRVIAVKNTAGVAKTGLKCYFTYPNDGGSPTPVDTNDCEFEVGFAAPTADDCGDLMTESISNIYAVPYTVTMEADKVGVGSSLAIGTLDAGDYVCIFIRRKIKAAAQLPKSDDDLLAIMEGTLTLITIEDISLTFAWD
jgi:hypothetical protein